MRYLDAEGDALLHVCQALAENEYGDDDIVCLNGNSLFNELWF